jgi:hypothetical protein
MVAFVVLVLIVAVIAAFDGLALSSGADSRESMPDTHVR